MGKNIILKVLQFSGKHAVQLLKVDYYCDKKSTYAPTQWFPFWYKTSTSEVLLI